MATVLPKDISQLVRWAGRNGFEEALSSCASHVIVAAARQEKMQKAMAVLLGQYGWTCTPPAAPEATATPRARRKRGGR